MLSTLLFFGGGIGLTFSEATVHCWGCVCVLTQLCLTLCDPMDCSPPGSSTHGIIQARILEWVAISSSKGSSWPRDWPCICCIGRWILYQWATREANSSLPFSNKLFWPQLKGCWNEDPSLFSTARSDTAFRILVILVSCLLSGFLKSTLNWITLFCLALS